MILSSASFLIFSFYFRNTEIAPADGGKYIEGVVGQPRFINPVLAATNDVDRDLVELIFSGLMKYDASGQIVPDLAKDFKILEEGRTYEFYLRENAYWHDGALVTADDIIFTIKVIQDSNYKSPLQANWLNIDIEKISDYAIRFKLKKPYSAFLENITLKILPKHIFSEMTPEGFPLTVYNLKPIGSGPFRLKSLTQDKAGNIKSLNLVRNLNYFDKIPFLKEISFQFFDTENDLIDAAKTEKINGFVPLWPDKNGFAAKKNFKGYEILMPRYFAVFFNLSGSKVLSEKEIRQALNLGTNKQELIEKALYGQGKIVDSPILPDVFGLAMPTQIYEFNPEKAKELLEEAGYKLKQNICKETENNCNETIFREKVIKKETVFQFKSNLKVGSRGDEVRELQKCLAEDPSIYPEGEITGYFGETTKKVVIRFQEKYAKEILEPWGLTEGTGDVKKTTREKLNELCGESPIEVRPLQFSMVVPDQPLLVEVVNILKRQWQEIGVNLEVKIISPSQIVQDFIKPRNYDSLLFGEVLGSIPDLFPFWHSSQKRDPGFNLAIYENKEADALLKSALEIQNSTERAKKYEEFQDILIDDAPAVFLYRPDYIYLVSQEIKGIEVKKITDPSNRFINIENWYRETKRVWQ